MAVTYATKVQNGDFAVRLQTADLAALVADPAGLAAIKALIDKHLVLHVTPDALITKEAVGQLAYGLGYPKGGAPRAARPAADGYTAAASMAAGAAAPRSVPLSGEYSFIGDFGAKAKPNINVPRVPSYIESLHYDGISGYSVQTAFNTPVTTPNLWIDMRGAYRTLPRDLKKVVDTSHALHASMATPATPYVELPPLDAKTASRRPLAIRHFRTGEPLLHLPKNPASIIEGMGEAEGRAILHELWARVDTSKARYATRMEHNNLVVWDGMGTVHTNPAYPRDKDRTIWFFIIPSATTTLTPAAGA